MIRRPPRSTLFPTRRSSDLAGLSEFLEGLPRGLDTYLGEGGARLSGGERQRLAGARAFLKSAPLLVLDEIGRSTRLNSSHANISYAVFCLEKKIHLSRIRSI